MSTDQSAALVRCQICASTTGTIATVREMMFGAGESFRYFQCGDCGCIQLTDPPEDLAPYYPSTYYSMAAPIVRRGLRGRMRRIRNRGTFAPQGLLDRALSRAFPYPVAGAADWMRRAGAGPGARVLDVGCGSGVILLDLYAAGYRRLLGVDPFVASDIRYPNGVEVRRASIHEVDGEFDLIMLHHVLEHVPDQLDMLRAVAQRLAPNGCCIVRIPKSPCWAWEHYRELWVQLDAPRHFFIHSPTSLRHTAADAGLRVDAMIDDSTEFQFGGSELYRRGEVLNTEFTTTFGRAQVRAWRRQARRLNAQQLGDQAVFYLRRA